MTGAEEAQLLGTRYRSRQEQREAYLEGEWGNPLTTSHRGGRVLNACQIPLFLVLPPRGVAVLTTTGRKTGKKRRNCVRAVARGNKVFLVSLRGRHGHWYRNLIAEPHVELRIKGGHFRGSAREIFDPAEYEEARAAYCDTVTRFDRLEYLNHRTGLPTRERIRGLHSRWFSICAPLVVDLEAAPIRRRRRPWTGAPRSGDCCRDLAALGSHVRWSRRGPVPRRGARCTCWADAARGPRGEARGGDPPG